MRLDISHILNFDKLDFVISSVGKENIDYMVMSKKTCYDLSIGCDRACNYQGVGGCYLKYRDISIAVCERLPYGEVEFVKLVKGYEEI